MKNSSKTGPKQSSKHGSKQASKRTSKRLSKDGPSDKTNARTNNSFSFQTSSAPTVNEKTPSSVLVIDVGGTHVKIIATGVETALRFDSGPKMTAEEMVEGVIKLAADWKYDAVSIGYPGAVLHGKPVGEPYELGGGWVCFDFDKAFGCPVKVINDAAMQAMGSYEGGKMLFLGLGTGLGSTMIADGIVEPMELAHLPYKDETYEDYLGKRGEKRLGKKEWRKTVDVIVAKLSTALEPDYVVIGGGNAKKLGKLPDNCRLGDNALAFLGGFRLWGMSAKTPLVDGRGRGRPVTTDGQKPKLFLQPDPKTDTQVVLKEKSKAEIKAESKASKAQLKADPKSKAEPKGKAKAEPKLKPDSKGKAKADPKLKAEPKGKAKTDPKLKAEPKGKAKTDLKGKPKVDPKAKSDSKGKAKTDPEAKSKTKLKVKPKTAPKAKQKAELKGKAKKNA